jgi:hypothetical protein
MRTLQFVSPIRWMREELEAAVQSLPDWELKSYYGFDVPPLDYNEPFWMEQESLARFNHSLFHHGRPLLEPIAPSPDMLASLPRSLTGRVVKTVSVLEATSTVIEWDDLWWKLSASKNSSFLASKRSHQDLFTDLQNAKLPWGAVLQYSTDFVSPIRSEFRFFVKKRQIAAYSGYLKNGVTIYDGAIFESGEREQAYTAAESLLKRIPSHLCPTSFVMDTVMLENGESYILEFNPTWCSAWYECDLASVLECLSLSFYDTTQAKKTFLWEPDQDLTHRYMRNNSYCLPLANKQDC